MTGLDSETRSLVARTLERFAAEHCDPAQRLARLPAQPPDYRTQSHGDGAGLQATKPRVRTATVNDQFLYGRRWSAFGGGNEIQRNRIAAQQLRG